MTNTPAPQHPTDPFAPAKLGPVTLRNRIIKAATFEGMSPGGTVTPGLVDYHRRVAAGGVGMSTVAYCAVARDARGMPNELVMNSESLAGLRELTDAIHAEGAAAATQLGHAGPVAMGAGETPLTPSRVFSPMAMRFTRAARREDIARITADFASAAGVAREAGFDCVELHLGHHYLLSSFHSPKWNRRRDEYGGTLENRARFSREVARSVREAVGPDVAVTAKLNMMDGVPGGLWVDESLEIARLLAADGSLDALQLTGGGSFGNPMYLFRGEAPVAEMATSMPGALRLGFRLFGGWFLKEYPFEEAYFRRAARQFRDGVDLPIVLLGGINRLDTIRDALAEGFAFVAMARALLRQPDLVRQFQEGRAADSLCLHCNKCMPTISTGTHCVLVPPDQRPGSPPPAEWATAR